jgi:hypothetical protein
MPLPCRVNSHMPCRAPAILWQCCVLRESPRGRLKYPNCWFTVTTFVELRVVAGRNRRRAGRPHDVSGRPMLILTYHAVPTPRCAVALRSRFQNGMVMAWHGMCESNTAALCKSNGKDKSKPVAERHGMCESNTAALCKSNGKDTI